MDVLFDWHNVSNKGRLKPPNGNFCNLPTGIFLADDDKIRGKGDMLPCHLALRTSWKERDNRFAHD